MLLIRPIVASDLNALKQIAIESGHGFTSLPNNETLLSGKIEKAENSFSSDASTPGDQSYLFVLEDTGTHEVVGITGIEACVGTAVPLYHYRLETINNQCASLGVNKSINTLTFCDDYAGASEVCTLFVREEYRKQKVGQLMSRVRFLFMANHPQRFSNKVIAEMRGVSDSEGNSPFWAWLEKNFFGIDFPTADYLVGIGNKGFISELMPKHPIYVSLLSKEAQAVIGQVHANTKPALRLLEKEGFQFNNYVDLFDAGPTVEIPLQDIRSIRESQSCQVQVTKTAEISKVTETAQAQQSYFICNDQVKNFRAIASTEASYEIDNNLLIISQTLATALLLKTGDYVRFLCL
ncbi:arginine N-succinyltransferase [Paraglaciecola aquimarina]|uniref:Arginine N-succinyltransferase n=1 Tax=Paraglaciecola algarum TaxID=3050085 RepID=A0ABS9D4E1_9ALTE|nr:arginine N-succinyltransferase [Paraglaciecola sp. G1-23]MCF2947789.1 arginine N-succinyltransferase [Paraglaciecola sp. G1-23]